MKKKGGLGDQCDTEEGNQRSETSYILLNSIVRRNTTQQQQSWTQAGEKQSFRHG